MKGVSKKFIWGFKLFYFVRGCIFLAVLKKLFLEESEFFFAWVIFFIICIAVQKFFVVVLWVHLFLFCFAGPTISFSVLKIPQKILRGF